MIHGQVETVRGTIALGRAADRNLLGTGVLQGLASIGVGLGLLAHRSPAPPLHEPSAYTYLSQTPGWPVALGIVLTLLGVVEVLAIGRFHNARLRQWVFTVASAAWTLYAALYAGGVLIGGGPWSDQILYMLLAGAAMLQSAYAKRARCVPGRS